MGSEFLNLLKEAEERLKQAQQNFNWADQDHIDAAIYELMAAEENMNALLKRRLIQ